MKLLSGTLTFLFVVYRIRSGVSKELSKRINMRLPEEVQLEEIMSNVQKWQTQLKRKSQVRLSVIYILLTKVCIKGTGPRNGVSLSSVQELLKEADSFPVDLESETRIFRNAADAACSWITTHTSMLSLLEIPVTSVDMTISPDIGSAFANDGGEGVSEMHMNDDEEDAVNQAVRKMSDPNLGMITEEMPSSVGYPDLKLLVESANGIVMKFPELT